MFCQFEAGAAEQETGVRSLAPGTHNEEISTDRWIGHSQHHRTRVAVLDFELGA
jgi:hypothetical protein